jgi:hypothetical protein
VSNDIEVPVPVPVVWKCFDCSGVVF